MLVLKKMPPKKIAVYLMVMLVMIGGTGFMLYQNYKLTSGSGGAASIPAQYNNMMLAAPPLAAPGGGEQPAVAESKAASQPLDADKLKKNGGLDLTIFSSEKFKVLEENGVSGAERPETGKRDPFQP